MKSFKEMLIESLDTFNSIDEAGRCWSGYKPVPGKEPYSKGSCVKEDSEEDIQEESEYQGEKVTLN